MAGRKSTPHPGFKNTLSRTSVKGENLENKGQEREDGDIDLSYELM